MFENKEQIIAVFTDLLNGGIKGGLFSNAEPIDTVRAAINFVDTKMQVIPPDAPEGDGSAWDQRKADMKAGAAKRK